MAVRPVIQHKQFKGVTKRREFYDRKVHRTGSTVLLSLGKVLPHEWSYVRITPLKRTDNSVELLIEKLLELDNNAPNKTINMRHKQNT